MKKINLMFRRESFNKKILGNVDYRTKGIFELKDGFNALTYKDVEIAKDIHVVWPDSENPNFVLVESDNKLKFSIEEDNKCLYRTNYGTILVNIRTYCIKWNGKILMISYRLTNNENMIGKYIIKFTFEDKLIKE